MYDNRYENAATLTQPTQQTQIPQKTHKKARSVISLVSLNESQPTSRLLYGSNIGGGKAISSLNKKKKNRKCPSWYPESKCCNLCMCGYICLLLLVLLAIFIPILIYEIVPLLNFGVDIKALHIQLFEYGIYRQHFLNRFETVYLDGTGAFIVEAYNPGKVGVYMHDWEIRLSALNLFLNPEEWGHVKCCGEEPKWNKTNPFIGNETFEFNKKQWFGKDEINNLTMILFVDGITEELFYIGWQVSYLNDWRLNLRLNGNGWGTTNIFGLDVNVVIDCSIDVNSSNFLPFTPPHFNISWNLTQDDAFREFHHYNDYYYNEEEEQCEKYSFLEHNIGRLPPRRYYWQEFPVIDLNCTFSIAKVRKA